MMPDEPTRDVMRRTMQNLQFVEAHKGPAGPHEVTQLLNSFLGALVHPWEAFRNDLSGKSLAEAVATGWPHIAKERRSDRDPESLSDLVRLMRNAIAHGNLEFLPGSTGDIRALRIWNNDRGRRTWGALLTVTEMRAFLECFVNLAEELDTDQNRSAPRRA
jgi:HEPN pEK499 p136